MAIWNLLLTGRPAGRDVKWKRTKENWCRVYCITIGNVTSCLQSTQCIMQKMPTKMPSCHIRKMFDACLVEQYAVMEDNLMATLVEVEPFSTTADIWTANNQSCVGTTVNWISRSTLEHNSATIACKRKGGQHLEDNNKSVHYMDP